MNNTNPTRFILLALLCLLTIENVAAENSNPSEKCTEENYDMCNVPPLISCPPFVWLKPTEISHPSRTGEPVVEPGGPGCGEPIVIYRDSEEIINLCHVIITRTWYAIDPDNASLFDTCQQTIKQVDEEPPLIENVPDDITIFANRSNCRSMVTWTEPTIFDNVLLDDIVITGERNGQTFVTNNGEMFDEGVTTITYRATDICTNFTEVSFTITVLCADCHIICPDDVCVDVGSDISPNALGFAQAYSGNVDCGTADIDFNDIMIDTRCNGAMVFLRGWSAVFSELPDMQFSCSQRIELKADSEILLSECPPDVVVETNFTPAYWEEPTASNGANDVFLTATHTPGSLFPVGLTTVTYTATDDCGNEASCSFKVSVLDDATYDDCPDDILLSCDGSGSVIAEWDPPVYNRSCGTCPEGRQIPGFIYIGSLNGSHYYCSRSNYTYTQAKAAADRLKGHIVSINSEEENHYIATHIGSRTAMIGLTDIAKEGDFVWESGEELSYENWFSNQPNDKDNFQDIVEIDRAGLWNDVDNDLSLEFVLEIPCEFVTQVSGPQQGADLTPGIYTVTYVIADGCGLEEYCSFDLLVEDGLWMTCIDDIIVRISSTEGSAIVEFELPEASSCCNQCTNQNDCAIVTQVDGPPSGSSFALNSTTAITYRATDPCGNKLECSFNIIIEERAGSRLGNGSYGGNIERGTTDNEEEIIITDYKYYPNPVSDILTIETPDHADINRISIMSLEGQTISELSSISSSNKISMENLIPGLYLVLIEYHSGDIRYEKIMKI
jgi:hypothetical protein